MDRAADRARVLGGQRLPVGDHLVGVAGLVDQARPGTAVRRHHVQLSAVLLCTVADEDDFRSVGRERRQGVEGGGVGQPHEAAAVGMDLVDVEVALLGTVGLEHDPLSVR